MLTQVRRLLYKVLDSFNSTNSRDCPPSTTVGWGGRTGGLVTVFVNNLGAGF